MKKINKKSINYSLKILTILAFAFIFMPFNKASAQQYDSNGFLPVHGYWSDWTNVNNSNYNNNSYYNPNNAPYQAPIYTAPASTTPVVYSNSTNPNSANIMTVSYKPATKTVAKATTSTPKTVATTSATNDSGKNLAANVVYGSNSFLPTGLIQWILFAIAILLIVILTRKIFGGEKNYHAIPMKHD